MTMRRAEDEAGTAQAVIKFLGPAQSRDESLKHAQLHATLAVFEALKECERHLYSLTVGRSA